MCCEVTRAYEGFFHFGIATANTPVSAFISAILRKYLANLTFQQHRRRKIVDNRNSFLFLSISAARAQSHSNFGNRPPGVSL